MPNEAVTISDWLAGHPGSSGAQICMGLGLSPARMYPALALMEKGGAVEGQWETPEPRADGKPRRRLYWIAAIRAIDLTKPVEE